MNVPMTEAELLEIMSQNTELRRQLQQTVLQNGVLQKALEVANENAVAWKKDVEVAERLLRELQERYDIYAKHLKTCAVYIGQEIPCDCGFICGTGMPFGQSGVPDFCTKPKPCPEHSSKNEKRQILGQKNGGEDAEK